MATTSVALGRNSKLNITTQTVIAVGSGRVVRVMVNTPGSTAGTISDSATTGGVAASNLIANIPNVANTMVYLDFPYTNGLVITPGTSQVLSVSYT